MVSGIRTDTIIGTGADTRVECFTRTCEICANAATQIPVVIYVYNNFVKFVSNAVKLVAVTQFLEKKDMLRNFVSITEQLWKNHIP